MSQRDLGGLVMSGVGRVQPCDGVVPWLVVDDDGHAIEPIELFLRDFVARGNSRGSVRSYAFALLRWWRWLATVEVPWDRATSAEVRDLVLWLQLHEKQRRSTRLASAETAGTVNLRTGKSYLDDHFAARTIRHSNAVVASFYEYWMDTGIGLLVNPVVRQRSRAGGRPFAHHNPMDTYRAEGRLRYNPRLPRRRPRALSDESWQELFGALGSDRDRALLSMAVCNGVRAAEMLGIRSCDVDWGNQSVRVVRKGTRAEQWLPVSGEALVWLRLYLVTVGPLQPADPVWVTLRRRSRGGGLERQPMTYETLRAVVRRVNAKLGTNWSMHDLRHTAALRMAADEELSLRDVQVILGHAHLETTADIYLVEEERHTVDRVAEHLARRSEPAPPVNPVSVGYNADDLAVLFGDGMLP